MDKEGSIEKESFLKKNYKIILVIAGILILLFLIGKEKPVIDPIWIFLLIVAFALYLFYQAYMKRVRHEDVYKMLERIKKEEAKRGVIIDTSLDNVHVEELGTDRFGVHVLDANRTYIRNPAIGTTGVDLRNLNEHRDDIQRFIINRAIAEGKIKQTELV